MALLGLGLAAVLVAGFASTASAEPRPLNDGGMIFGTIQSPSDPEEFEFEVALGEEQELRQIDERDVGVYDSGYPSFNIAAEPASDANGAAVPTTLAYTGENIVTLTVHHRAGNPAAGWAPFDYPITGGTGWEGGFRTTVVQMPSPNPPAPTCLVPKLRGYSLAVDRRRLRAAHCSLGPVRGRRSKGTKVVEQYRQPGQTLPADAPVGVRL